MGLSDKQWQFLQDIAKLIVFADKNGYKLTAGQFWRPDELQEYYFKQGLSKTKTNRHGQRLAADLNVFFEGKYLSNDREKIKPLGVYWESLNTHNRWGGSWRGLVEAGKSSFIDSNHFERVS